jgi:hypothetical protein
MNMPREEPKRLGPSSGRSIRPRRRRRRKRRARTDWKWIVVVAALAILAAFIGSTDLPSDDPGDDVAEEEDEE